MNTVDAMVTSCAACKKAADHLVVRDAIRETVRASCLLCGNIRKLSHAEWRDILNTSEGSELAPMGEAAK